MRHVKQPRVQPAAEAACRPGRTERLCREPPRDFPSLGLGRKTHTGLQKTTKRAVRDRRRKQRGDQQFLQAGLCGLVAPSPPPPLHISLQTPARFCCHLPQPSLLCNSFEKALHRNLYGKLLFRILVLSCKEATIRERGRDASDFSEIHPNKKHAECSLFSSISIGLEPPRRLSFPLPRVICQTPSGLQLLLTIP